MIRMCTALAAALAATALGATSLENPDPWRSGTTKSFSLERATASEQSEGLFEDGVYYVGLFAAYGKPCTVTATSAATVEIEAYEMTAGGIERSWAFGGYQSNGKFILFVNASDWGSYEGKDTSTDYTQKFALKVSGPTGANVTLSISHTEHAISSGGDTVQTGTSSQPKSITFSEDKQKSLTANYVGGKYFMVATLKAGVAYKVGTSGAKTGKTPQIGVSARDNKGTATMVAYDEWTKGADVGYLFTPTVSGNYTILLSGVAGAGSNKFLYQQVSGRKPSEHKPPALATPTAGSPVVADAVPGHRSALGSGFHDEVIDESLFAVNLSAGSLYSFATANAKTNLVMELYDANGSVLTSNRCGSAENAFDCLAAFRPSADGTYYLGVCQDLADDVRDTPLGQPVGLTLSLVTDGELDDWDPDDDDLEAVPAESYFVPALGKAGDDVLVAGALHGKHTLSIRDWVDCYGLACRKGLGYRIKAKTSDDACAARWPLTGTLYELSKDSKGKTTRTKVTSGNLLTDGVSVDAAKNATYFLEVVAEGGRGVSYPYEIYSLVCDPEGGELGTLQVMIEGAPSATWSLAADGKDAQKYRSGASVVLPVNGDNKVVFSSVSGRNRPSDVADPGVKAGEVVTVTGRYSDTVDANANGYAKDATDGDGAPKAKKVTTLKPAAIAKGKSAPAVSRTLWAEDRADWYKFAAAPSTCYFFRLNPARTRGDAWIDVFATAGEDELLASGTNVAYVCRATKSTTLYVRVAHAAGGIGESEYELEYWSQKIGTIGFDKVSYSVKDNAATVTLKVKRTGGTEGEARVRCETVSGTAVAGENFVAVSNVLTWAAGNSKDASVVIKLIPDLVGAWHEDRVFTVRLLPEPGEIAPPFGKTEATVTITPATKKSTGSVQFSGWGYDSAAFAKPSKPAASVAAGDSLWLWLSRTGGGDGEIAVTVTPTKGKAAAGVDFDGEPETIVWADGDTEDKKFVLRTFDGAESYFTAKTMTVKLAADKSFADKAKKVGAAATVSIVSPLMSRSVESYSASIPKSEGLTVKAGKADTWYFDASGDLRTVTPAAGKAADLTVTVTGPGKLAFTPFFDKDDADKSTFTCKNGKKAVALTFGEENVLYLPKGKATLSFSLKRDKKSAGDVIASFADQGDGQPFAWKPLPLPSCVSPMPGEVAATVTCGKKSEDDDEEAVRFLWDAADDGEVAYLFTLDENKKNLGKASARVAPRLCPTGETEVAVICSSCGRVSVVPPNKIATGETYYWRVDSVLLKDGQPVLTNVNTAVWTVNPMKCAGLPQPVIASGTDADGNDIAALEKEGSAYPVKLVQGVAADLQLAGTNVFDYATKVEFRLASGSAKLPAGLSISNGRITGTPTKLGTTVCAVGIRVTYPDSSKPGKSIVADYSTIAFKFTVVSPELAAGTFNGLVSTEDARIAGSASLFGQTFGSLKVTASADGKISASVSLGGSTYKFSGKKGYGACVPCLDNGLPGVTVTLSNAVTLTTVNGKTKVKNKCVDTLTLTTTRADASDWAALDSAMVAELSVNMLSADKKSVLSDIRFSGEARRDSIKVAEVAEGLSGFTGYYTVSLNPTNEVKGVTGSGYLGVTLDKKGVAKVTGVLADGGKVSVSATASYVSELADGCERILVPVYGWIGKKEAFGGWLAIALGEDGIARVASEGQALRWLNTDKAASSDGKAGYGLALEPIGGYYNTVYNLQRYYLDEEFHIKGLDLDEIPAEFFGGKIPTVYPGSFDAILDWQINSLKLASNPANIKFTFKRATGIWTGTFDIFVEGQSKKFGGKSYSHQGVLVMYRDPAATIGEDVPMMGFYQLPIKSGGRSWTASLPFDVVVPSDVFPKFRGAVWDPE